MLKTYCAWTVRVKYEYVFKTIGLIYQVQTQSAFQVGVFSFDNSIKSVFEYNFTQLMMEVKQKECSKNGYLRYLSAKEIRNPANNELLSTLNTSLQILFSNGKIYFMSEINGSMH